MSETFVEMQELQCPACRQLGWVKHQNENVITGVLAHPRKFFSIQGVMSPPKIDVVFFIKCGTCKSVVGWHYATFRFDIIELGVRCNVRREIKVPFE
jgi:hypothetical protein